MLVRRFTADFASAGNLFPVKPKPAIADFSFVTADIASAVLLPVRNKTKQPPMSKNKNWSLWRLDDVVAQVLTTNIARKVP